MNIFYERNNRKLGIVYSESISFIDLPGRIADNLEVGNGCNLFNLLMKLAKIEINAAKGSKYIACVKERKYVEIYFRSKKLLKTMIRVAVFNGDKESPKKFEKVLRMAVTNAWKSLGIISEREKIISSRS